MRIGIDGTCLGVRRGYGRFLRELLPRLLDCDRANDYLLFIDRQSASGVPALECEIVEAPTSAAQADAASARGNRSPRDLWIMGRTMARARLDLIYFPSVYSYYPVRGRTPVAVALHDTIAERYARVVFPTLRTRWLWKLKVRMAIHRASGLITVSEWSRTSLADWFGIAASRIYVTPEAPAAAFRPVGDPEPRRRWLRQHGLPADDAYLIYVGGFNPHKNLGLLVDAFGALVDADPGLPLRLLLVGDHRGDLFHSEVQALRGRIAGLELEERVVFAGFVPDDELRHLYAGAVALVMPSLEEGFGLPAVEAAACGAPAVATRNSPLPQLLEGGGIFVEPTDREALTAALERLVRRPEERARLGQRALERAGGLSWRVTARATRDALHDIAAAAATRRPSG